MRPLGLASSFKRGRGRAAPHPARLQLHTCALLAHVLEHLSRILADAVDERLHQLLEVRRRVDAEHLPSESATRVGTRSPYRIWIVRRNCSQSEVRSRGMLPLTVSLASAHAIASDGNPWD